MFSDFLGEKYVIKYREVFLLLKFPEMIERYPDLLKILLESKRFSLETITQAQIKQMLRSKIPVAGVYLITDSEDRPLYVGRSKNLAQRIGRDHRSLNKNAANLTYRISIMNNISHKEARDYVFGDFFVRFLKVENEHDRTVFEVFVAMELDTPYNSFLEH
ncbi:GIY-YIG nuclease family protein [Pseudalkalibacillus decolorationis]|uniref:GIY-YIG nuclease family protein n=1 Tax=Pseudalkalibacillus decolorationis TaxID=163879 RepID=UPI0021494369|nr:GIY-YIG nuclease family protein [Pseudalkalibacillus decolorationis]